MDEIVFLVEKRRPIRAAVDCFPNAARDRAKIISARLAGNAFDRQRASAAERPDLSPLHAFK